MESRRGVAVKSTISIVRCSTWDIPVVGSSKRLTGIASSLFVDDEIFLHAKISRRDKRSHHFGFIAVCFHNYVDVSLFL